MERLDTGGSTLFSLTWRRKTTPLGRRYLERAVSGHRTSGSGCTSWRTTSTEDQVLLATWASPRATDGEKGGPNQRGSKGDAMLPSMASWATPKVKPGKYQYASGDHGRPYLNLEGQADLAVSGETPNGSGAGTGSIGQLNPAHSRWLMGLLPVWDDCAVTATRSLRPSRKRSSRRTWK